MATLARALVRQALARTSTLRRAALTTASAGIATFCYAPHAEALQGPPPINKEIYEVSISVSAAVADKFEHWLPGYVKSLLELPGFLGAKVLTPLNPAALKPAVIFVLGGPGAGKGTQSGYIVDKYGYVHLSAGDLLRAERKSGSAQGQLIDEYIAEGKIVPVEITVKLLVNAMKENGGKRFLVDGFPRNTNNLSGWQQVTGDELSVVGVLFYDCPEEVMEARLLERGKTSGRTDDNIESIRKRFKTYVNETRPILEYFEHQGLVHKVDGTQEMDMVWRESQAAVDGIEERLLQQRVEYRIHVHSTTPTPAMQAATGGSVVGKMSSDMLRKWGADDVKIDGRGFAVSDSSKAFGLEALRSFD